MTAPAPSTHESPSTADRPRTFARMVGRFRPVRHAAAGVFLLVLLRSALEIAQPQLLAHIIQVLKDAFGTTETPAVLPSLLVALGLVMLVREVVTYASGVAATHVGQDVENRLRRDLFQHVLALRFGYHDRHRSGETIARSLRDMEQTKRFYREVWFGYLQLGVLVLAVLLAIAWQHWTYLVAVLPLYMIAITTCVIAGRRVARMDRVVSDDYDEVTSVLTENVAGARVVRAFGRERDEIARFGARMDTFTQGWGRLERFWAGLMPVVNHLYPLALATVLGVGAVRIASHGARLEEVLAALLCARLVKNRVRPLTRLVIMGQKASASAARVFEVLDEQEIVEAPAAPRELPPKGGTLRFDDVHFGHSEGTSVLRGVELEVPAGGSLGILGPTGSGKSSLVNLLPRFYEPTSGRILLDGVDLRELPIEVLRKEVALVFQEPFLFSDTIAGNVAYGRPGLSEAEIQRCVGLAAAAPFIAELEAGLETMVGERGVSLSGGQRQRLTIARALAQDPRVLVFDDATASVDAETERILFEGIRAAADGRTTLVISQRVPSVRWCDRIAVLDEGRITTVGTHEELLATSALYREIEQHQRLEEVSS